MNNSSVLMMSSLFTLGLRLSLKTEGEGLERSLVFRVQEGSDERHYGVEL